VTAQVAHTYSYALSGFTVQAPTAAQLAALAADPQVLSVMEDKQVSIRTYSTPQFLGLPNRARQVQGSGSKPSMVRQRGVWSQVKTPFSLPYSFFILLFFLFFANGDGGCCKATRTVDVCGQVPGGGGCEGDTVDCV
jgi:hypothetical protein